MSNENEIENETTISVRMDENGNVLSHNANDKVNVASPYKGMTGVMDTSLITTNPDGTVTKETGGQPDAGKPMSAFESASPLSTMHKKNSSIPANNMQEVAADPENYIMTISGVEGTVQSFIAQGLVKINGLGNITDARTVTDATTPRLSPEQIENSVPYNPLDERATSIMNTLSEAIGDQSAGSAFVEVITKVLNNENFDGSAAEAIHEGAKVLQKYRPQMPIEGAFQITDALVSGFSSKTAANLSQIDPTVDSDKFLEFVTTMRPEAFTSALIEISYGSTAGLKRLVQAYKLGNRG